MRSLQHFLLDNHCYHTISVTRGREPLFADSINAEILAASIRHAGDSQAYVLAWAVMPDHVHLVLVPRDGHQLAKIMQGIKGATARRINQRRGATGPLWQQGYFDRVVRTEKHLLNAVRYVNANPIMAEIVLGREEIRDLETAEVAGWLGASVEIGEPRVRQLNPAEESQGLEALPAEAGEPRLRLLEGVDESLPSAYLPL